MTAFKPGDEVDVAVRAKVVQSGALSTQVHYSDPYSGERETWVATRICTLVRPPLQQNDVLTADDPEPPEDTVIRSARGGVWVRGEFAWLHAGSRGLTWAWKDIATGEPITVLYVPEVTP